jgi:GT2 family glycosyltransferase
MVGYSISDLELTAPLPDLGVDQSEGLALIVRRKGRVLGFLMKAFPSGAVVDRGALEEWISAHIAVRWVQESVREELCASLPANNLPRLTIAICTKDRPEYLRRCLRSLLDLREQHDDLVSEWDILVVDNAPSISQTKDLVASLPDVRYVVEARPGLNFARNRALREANGDLLAYLDDDVVVDRRWFQGLWGAWSENPDAGAFTGQVLPLELETEAQVLFERRGGFRHGFDKLRYTQSIPNGDDGYLYPCRTGIFGVGCNMAFHRKTLQEIGGFDEALDTGRPLPGGGDHDIFYRIIRAGYPLIYEPDYLVFHQHRRTMEQLRHQYWTWGLSVMAFASKSHASDRSLRPLWRILILRWFSSHARELAAALFGRHCLPASFLLWELVGGVVGLFGEYGRSRRRIAEIKRRHP